MTVTRIESKKVSTYKYEKISITPKVFPAKNAWTKCYEKFGILGFEFDLYCPLLFSTIIKLLAPEKY